MAVKLILDLDTGIDDALAIAYALGSPELELIGVTCTYGNVTTELAVRNSLAVLALLGRTDIPVFAGQACASCADSFEPSPLVRRIHGDNGLGGVRIPDSPRPAEQGGAVDFIVESARRHGADLVYVPTGSSTNIAAAFGADPSLADRLRVVMMGGALTTRGNTTPWSEANVSQDPEASDALLRRGRVTMVGLDVTHQTLLTKAATARWRRLGTAAGTAFADMTDYYIDFEASEIGIAGCGLHDPLAVAVAADESLVGVLPMNLRVDLAGPTRGRTIGSLEGLAEPDKRTRAAVRVDAERFLTGFMDRTERVLGAR